jgi:hypothetical protein
MCKEHYDGKLVTAKYISAHYVFFTQISGSLRCYF